MHTNLNWFKQYSALYFVYYKKPSTVKDSNKQALFKLSDESSKTNKKLRNQSNCFEIELRKHYVNFRVEYRIIGP